MRQRPAECANGQRIRQRPAPCHAADHGDARPACSRPGVMMANTTGVSECIIFAAAGEALGIVRVARSSCNARPAAAVDHLGIARRTRSFTARNRSAILRRTPDHALIQPFAVRECAHGITSGAVPVAKQLSIRRLASGPLNAMNLTAFLAHHGIEVQRFEHPPVMTVEESERLVPPLPGAKTKNLFLRDKKGAASFSRHGSASMLRWTSTRSGRNSVQGGSDSLPRSG